MCRLNRNGNEGTSVIAADQKIRGSPRPPIWHDYVLAVKNLQYTPGSQPVPRDLLFILVIEEEVRDQEA
jgi:hypothetical protein